MDLAINTQKTEVSEALKVYLPDMYAHDGIYIQGERSMGGGSVGEVGGMGGAMPPPFPLTLRT